MELTVIFKIVLVLLLLFIIFNLGRALFLMVKGRDPTKTEQKPMSHFLGRRVLLSALIVVALIIALASGFIDPNNRPY
ncbi:MAG: DUF2909 domain-containing protein [Aliivibrio sp.]|uniref:DUF2909 domain-containing protein n=1 Tax=Aliivibrio sp. TaxID=1872443 RepID=UPI001A4AAB89|nr:DUF2909 domain-containing protein [Aliivibrio sp.]